MKRLLFVALVAALSALAPPGEAGERGKVLPNPLDPGWKTGSERLAALVERVRLEQSRLKSLEARFVQYQESSLLIAPEESKGVFSYVAPDRVRWEYQTPNPISVVIKNEEMVTWYHDLKRAETVRIGKYSNQVFKYLGASGSLETLLAYFRVTLKLPGKAGEPYRLELVPKYERIAKRLRQMTLWIDGETFFPQRLRYVEADGDSTEYRFSDLKRNGRIPDDRFVLKLPKDVETKYIDLAGGTGPASSSRP
jgi:outer membrane lipoprotein-sorting protein